MLSLRNLSARIFGFQSRLHESLFQVRSAPPAELLFRKKVPAATGLLFPWSLSFSCSLFPSIFSCPVESKQSKPPSHLLLVVIYLFFRGSSKLIQSCSFLSFSNFSFKALIKATYLKSELLQAKQYPSTS